MKNMKLVVGALFLGGAIGLGGTSARAQDGDMISKDVVTDGSYCHMKFPAMREDTLDEAVPALNSSDVTLREYLFKWNSLKVRKETIT
ncbi:MAG TPA: hypothetical protein VMO00_14350 [Methylomirabilota bacterium]|nr:hypothetical protein [Methylomirabilota bacterium]